VLDEDVSAVVRKAEVVEASPPPPPLYAEFEYVGVPFEVVFFFEVVFEPLFTGPETTLVWAPLTRPFVLLIVDCTLIFGAITLPCFC